MNTKKVQNKIRRQKKIRVKLSGTNERPRVSVFKSNKHVYVQLIDDLTGKTLVSSSDAKTKIKGVTQASVVEIAKLVADSAKKAGISKVVFDRSGYRYHGVIKKLADSLRESGLQF